MTRLLPILTVFSLAFAFAAPVQATPRAKTRTEYVVTETHPFTGGTVSTTRFANREAANQHYALVSRAHWVQWRFVGINEPLRYRRFTTPFAAQGFIDTDGPSRSGKLGFAILTNETRNVASRVSLTTVNVPVTGGGRGGGNGNGREVIDTIDRIIGIIGR
jgi:hypothetical protein